LHKREYKESPRDGSGVLKGIGRSGTRLAGLAGRLKPDSSHTSLNTKKKIQEREDSRSLSAEKGTVPDKSYNVAREQEQM